MSPSSMSYDANSSKKLLKKWADLVTVRSNYSSLLQRLIWKKKLSVGSVSIFTQSHFLYTTCQNLAKSCEWPHQQQQFPWNIPPIMRFHGIVIKTASRVGTMRPIVPTCAVVFGAPSNSDKIRTKMLRSSKNSGCHWTLIHCIPKRINTLFLISIPGVL